MPLTVNGSVHVIKGCKGLLLEKRERGVVESVEEMGTEASGAVRVVINFTGSRKVLWARSAKALSGYEVRLNDGDPTRFVVVRAS